MTKVAFHGEAADRVQQLGEAYAVDVLPSLVRPVALDRIAWHTSRGDRVLVVSASLQPYLGPWCRAMGVDVICSQLEERDGKLTGEYVEGDCCGPEKESGSGRGMRSMSSRRSTPTADTEDDREMLQMAGKRFFRRDEVAELPRPSRVTRRGEGGT
jgi:HAD superfamily phosphoserine phosphatase-like hydrolase